MNSRSGGALASQEESWAALYQHAEAARPSGISLTEVVEVCRRNQQDSPDRVEALYRVGLHFRAREAYHLAHAFLKHAMRLSRTAVTDERPAGRGVCDYALPLEYALCCLRVGENERAADVYSGVLHGGKLPPGLVAQLITDRGAALEALYPKVANPATGANRIKVCVPFHNPGPRLEKCVISLLYQDYEDFHVVFVDDASDDGSHAGIPQGDPRVTLLRNVTRRGPNACLRQCLRRHGEPGDIIFPLDAAGWLAYCDALRTVNDFFNAYDCAVMYGQYRYDTGRLGRTVPLTAPELSNSLKEAGHAPSPFIFRRRLYDELEAARGLPAEGAGVGTRESEANALYYALLGRAGLGRARFSDHVLTVAGSEGRDAPPPSHS